MQANKNISKRRGLEFHWWRENTLGLLMVKAPIELVSPIVSSVLNGILEIDVLDKSYAPLSNGCRTIHQYQGHKWTIVFSFDICASSTVAKISEQLQSNCIYLVTEDTSGTASYQLFENGKIIEELDWGCDYTEEFLGVEPEDLFEFAQEREKAGNPLSQYWDPRQWDIYFVDEYGSYKFRSNKYKATSEEVQNTEIFLDRLLQDRDAWLPSYEYFPSIFPLIEGLDDFMLCVKEDFVRVDVIHDARTVNKAWAIVDSTNK
jgi:hypothetical protein